MDWSQPANLRAQVQKLWDKGKILSSIVDESPLFPKRLILRGPSSQDLSDRFDAVCRWIESLRQCPYCRFEMREIRHRIIGANTVPKEAWVDSLGDALSFIGKRKQAKLFAELLAITRARQPSVIEWIRKYPLKALALSEQWSKLLDLIDWLQTHPNPGIYIRQVDIPGIHTKFIEAHRGVLTALLNMALPPESINDPYQGIGQFSRRYGFLEKPALIRIRILDPEISLLPGANQDITVTPEAFISLDSDSRLQGKVQRIFITENEINFLAFPPMPSSIVIFGGGYGFDSLSGISWISDIPMTYWGDIDTHGFAILDQLRAHFPNAKSLLMDRETLFAHKPFWEKEEKQEQRDLTRLNRQEQQLYDDLRDNRLAPNIRLEQERIGFRWLLRSLSNPP